MTDDMPTVNGGDDNDDDDGNVAHGNIAPPTITTMTEMHLWQQLSRKRNNTADN